MQFSFRDRELQMLNAIGLKRADIPLARARCPHPLPPFSHGCGSILVKSFIHTFCVTCKPVKEINMSILLRHVNMYNGTT